MIDLRGYKVIYGNKVLNAVALDVVDFGKDFDFEKYEKTTIKPKFIGVLAINGDGNIVRITDEAWRFQFIPAINGEGGQTMSKEKRIEEMREKIRTEISKAVEGGLVTWTEFADWLTEALYNAGYRKQSEWISVDERLPEQYGPFLIADDKGNMEVATWTKQFGWFSGCNRVKRVTHWMPLPEPPKMKGGE